MALAHVRFYYIGKKNRNRPTIWLDGKEIIVSNRLKEVRIPLTPVVNVTESRFSREKIITITWSSRPNVVEEIIFLLPGSHVNFHFLIIPL